MFIFHNQGKKHEFENVFMFNFFSSLLHKCYVVTKTNHALKKTTAEKGEGKSWTKIACLHEYHIP